MLAPQQTIMRASANLRCEDAVAKLDFPWILNTLLTLFFDHTLMCAHCAKSHIVRAFSHMSPTLNPFLLLDNQSVGFMAWLLRSVWQKQSI